MKTRIKTDLVHLLEFGGYLVEPMHEFVEPLLSQIVILLLAGISLCGDGI